jgi:hypothetical protein
MEWHECMDKWGGGGPGGAGGWSNALTRQSLHYTFTVTPLISCLDYLDADLFPFNFPPPQVTYLHSFFPHPRLHHSFLVPSFVSLAYRLSIGIGFQFPILPAPSSSVQFEVNFGPASYK